MSSSAIFQGLGSCVVFAVVFIVLYSTTEHGLLYTALSSLFMVVAFLIVYNRQR